MKISLTKAKLNRYFKRLKKGKTIKISRIIDEEYDEMDNHKRK